MRNERTKSDSHELFRSFKGARGMSLNGRALAEDKFAYIQNMYVDYEEGLGGLESIPGFRKVLTLDDEPHSSAILTVGGEKILLFHIGSGLYRVTVSDADSSPTLTPIAQLQDCQSYAFGFGSLGIITDGSRLYAVDGYGEPQVISTHSAIAGCRTCALFDGRLFMSGNPDCPAKIFYSSRLDGESVSFSAEAYLTEGGGKGEILSLLCWGGGLWIFKSTDCGDGAVTCRKADGEGYPVVRSFSGPTPTGQAVGNEKEILFLCSEGLWAIERPLSADRAQIHRRSSDINPLLLSEDLWAADLTLWRGYALIGCGERIYLGYTGSEGGEYDWFILSGIGSYKNDRRVYRYADSAEEGYLVHKNTHACAEGQVLSLITEDKRLVCYTEEGKNKYAVYPTEEMDGGDFYPCTKLLSDGRLLWFYTSDCLCCFNSDKRGEAPDFIKCLPDYDEAEYKRRFAREIHPYFYSFCSHAPRYLIATAPDDCGLPHTQKISGQDSLVLNLLPRHVGKITVSINDNGRLLSRQTVAPLLKDCDSNRVFDGTRQIRISERTPLWLEKQIILEAGEFSSPFCLSSLSYKFQIKDKIKKG